MVKHVNSITALGRSGISDWLIQRVSAIIMAFYLIFLTGYFLSHASIDYATWAGLFSHPSMRIFSLLCLLSLLGHAWIGIWTILTDYIKCPIARGTLQILIILAFIACLAWGIQTLWSL